VDLQRAGVIRSTGKHGHQNSANDPALEAGRFSGNLSKGFSTRTSTPKLPATQSIESWKWCLHSVLPR
jgi:hypothetical protein